MPGPADRSPSPWPTPSWRSPKRKVGSSICGIGMLTKSFPFLPIISLLEMYFFRSCLIRPRTISRNRR